MKKRFMPRRARWIITLQKHGRKFAMVGTMGERSWVVYEMDTKPMLFRSWNEAKHNANCSKYYNEIEISQVYT